MMRHGLRDEFTARVLGIDVRLSRIERSVWMGIGGVIALATVLGSGVVAFFVEVAVRGK